MAKPRVITSCVANTYTGPNERIIEFSDRQVPAPDSGVTGGLVSLRRTTHHDRLMVALYSLSGPIDIVLSEPTDDVHIYVRGKRVYPREEG